MAKFHTATVSDIKKTTDDCSIIQLEFADEDRDVFVYQAGQYLTVQTSINGEEVRRAYSLCSSPFDRQWRIGVKKIPGGRFSTYANEVLRVGDRLEVMPPQGHFTVPFDSRKARSYIAFAAGSGITPVISLIKTALMTEPKSTFQLYYVNTMASTIILREELEGLKNAFMDRLEIFYLLTRQQRDIPFLNGRIDNHKLDYIFKHLKDVEGVDHFFTCGPEDMTMMISDYLKSKGVAKKKIHFELFGTDDMAARSKKYQLKESLKGQECEVTIIEGGKRMAFSMEQGAKNILDAALANSADLPYACKGGVCATCKAKLLQGEVDMLLSYGLEEDEIKAGYVLTCQAIPTSEKVVVDYDI